MIAHASYRHVFFPFEQFRKVKEMKIPQEKIQLWQLVCTIIVLLGGAGAFVLSEIRNSTTNEVEQRYNNEAVLKETGILKSQNTSLQLMIGEVQREFRAFKENDFVAFKQEVRDSLARHASRIDLLQQKQHRQQQPVFTREE